jgi:mscS mechanosensitive ion channel
MLLPIVIYILLYFIVTKALKILLRTKDKNYKKRETIYRFINNILKILILMLIVLSVLSSLGFNVGGFIAGLGLAGAVMGLAFQDFLKDIIAGITIITEDYFAIGDVIEIDDFKGTVLNITLRTTKIKKWDGPVLIINNKLITKVINSSMYNSFAIVDILVDIEENTEKINSILNRNLENFDKTLDKNIVDKPKILGINKIDKNYQSIRIICETKSEEQYNIERLLRKYVIDILLKEKVNMPYERLNLRNGK